MATVWIVESVNYDDQYPVGVFMSRDKALGWIAKQYPKFERMDRDYFQCGGESHDLSLNEYPVIE